MDKKIAIIGGSGVRKIFEKEISITNVSTPFGISQPIAIFRENEKEILFTNRHSLPGSKSFEHVIPPHKINSRTLIFALAKMGARRIIAINSVGALKKDLKLGSFAVLEQFIDMTKTRHYTFYDGTFLGHDEILGDTSIVKHIDMTEPFCAEMNELILETAKELKYDIVSKACYICTEGPRLETPAEINFYRMIGADVVGMTLIPEVILARELGLCYSSISIITNYAAGMQERVSFEEVKEVYSRNEEKLKRLLTLLIPKISEDKKCRC
ncbi:MAG TPA: MTAP family purine nucleoside phosphorylase [Geobacterales bacterium]|nr:MTAP family purine nucleoside phosphorylase [Geobacterales bacterium]